MDSLAARMSDKREKVPRYFVTTQQAADILGVSLRTVQLWSESGLLSCWKTEGGHRRIPRDAIDRLLADRGQRPAPGARAPVGAALAELDALRVLVVEDDADLLRLYRMRLAAWPMKPDVQTATNGFEALVRLGQTPFDLVLTDILMPELDGLRMLRALRALRHLDATEFVIVTGLDVRAIEERGGLPADTQVLPRPVPFDELERIAQQAALRLGRR